MRLPARSGRYQLQEQEANTFAIELLTPRHLLNRHMKPAAELDHVLALSNRFEISRAAAIRRYVELHGERLAAVVSEGRTIHSVEKSAGFPSLAMWVGAPLPDPPCAPDDQGLTELVEASPDDWLSQPERSQLFAQTLFQQDGWAITLLVAEPIEPELTTPTFTRSRRKP